MIDLLSIPSDEAERLAYAEGFTMAAQLFQRIDALTRQRDALIEALEDAEDRAAVRASLARIKAGTDDGLPAPLYRRSFYPFFYVRVALSAMFPWTLVCLGGLIDGVRHRQRGELMEPRRVLLWAWTAVIFGFFSASPKKICRKPSLILPEKNGIMPPMWWLTILRFGSSSNIPE